MLHDEVFASGAGQGSGGNARFSTRALRSATSGPVSRTGLNRFARLTGSGRVAISRRTSNAAGGPNRGFNNAGRTGARRGRQAGLPGAADSARRRARRLRDARRRGATRRG